VDGLTEEVAEVVAVVSGQDAEEDAQVTGKDLRTTARMLTDPPSWSGRSRRSATTVASQCIGGLSVV
jgi:hypothetical protein